MKTHKPKFKIGDKIMLVPAKARIKQDTTDSRLWIAEILAVTKPRHCDCDWERRMGKNITEEDTLYGHYHYRIKFLSANSAYYKSSRHSFRADEIDAEWVPYNNMAKTLYQ